MKYTENTLWRTDGGKLVKLKDLSTPSLEDKADWIHGHEERYCDFIELLTVIYSELDNRRNK